MDSLNISYTEESSILTEGEMSFTLYEKTNMANTQNMYCYFETRMTRHRGLVLWNQRTRVDSRVGTYNIFFFFFFPLVMQNYFIQEI